MSSEVLGCSGQGLNNDLWLPHLDDAGAGVRDDARHLHAVPSSSLAHDLAVEVVEDALVLQLQ